MPVTEATRVIWGLPDTEHNGPPVPIWSPRPGKPVEAILLENQLHGCSVHFVSGRTAPCMGKLLGCEGCNLGRRIDWKGYLAAFDHAHGRIGILEVTLEGFRTCSELQSTNPAFRGRRVKVTRCGASRQARVKVEIATGAFEGTLPAAFNVRKALERIWFGNRCGKVKARTERGVTIPESLSQIGNMPKD